MRVFPGRKSDVRDCHGIAQLLQHGLLKGSFIPPRPQREWRDRTRLRVQLVEEKTRIVHRLPKELEDANLKLASVATEILGASGRAMLEALIEGRKNPTQLADLAQRQLRGKIPELEKALEGHLTDHHPLHVAAAVATLGAAGGTDCRIGCQDRGANAPLGG